MSRYIVRQPIKSSTDNGIIGHEILYHGANQAFNVGPRSGASSEFAAADTIYNFLTANTDKLLSGSLNFMTFTTTLLLRRAPYLFNKDDLIIQIDDSVIIHPLAMYVVRQYKQEGYKIAVNQFQFSQRYLSIMDTIDYIKFDVGFVQDSTAQSMVKIAKGMGKQCICTGINSKELYDKAINLGVDALEGSFVAENISTKAYSSDYLQSNFFRLMVAVTRDEPTIDEIEEIVSVDATLTYGLLKMVNSCYFALRHRVDSIRQAVMTVGLRELKQWVYLLSASTENGEMDSSSEEILRLSFMRANFCSRLAGYAQDMTISRQDAYLMGMFSTLGYLIDADLEEILEQLPLREEIKQALIFKTGRAGILFDLVVQYEKAQWEETENLVVELGIPPQQLTEVYFQCMEEVSNIWGDITKPEPSQVSE